MPGGYLVTTVVEGVEKTASAARFVPRSAMKSVLSEDVAEAADILRGTKPSAQHTAFLWLSRGLQRAARRAGLCATFSHPKPGSSPVLLVSSNPKSIVCFSLDEKGNPVLQQQGNTRPVKIKFDARDGKFVPEASAEGRTALSVVAKELSAVLDDIDVERRNKVNNGS